MQGVRGGENLPAPAQEEQMQRVPKANHRGWARRLRRGEHLPAPAQEEQMQGVRGSEHLPAPAREEQLQGVRRGGESICPHQRIIRNVIDSKKSR
jgi:hypothetical protein